MISTEALRQLTRYAAARIVSAFDPSALVQPVDDLRSKLEEPHKGFYLGITDSQGELAREGFLREDQKNALDSFDQVVNPLISQIRASSLDLQRLKLAQFHVTVVREVNYMPDPLRWDQSKDGVFFQWGQDYRSILLPYQIARLNMTQTDVLDRLCQSSGLACSLWRLPEGLVWKLTCQSYSS